MKRREPKKRKKLFQRPEGHAPATELAIPLPASGHTAPVRVTTMRYCTESLIERDLTSPSELAGLRQPGTTLWINVDGVGEPHWLQSIGETFGLHTLALEDAVHVHQRAKVEEYGDHLFIVVRMVAASDRLSTEQVSLFLGPDFVITVQELPGGDCLDSVRQRLRTNSGRLRRGGADYLVYALIDAVIDSYFPVLERYGEDLDALDATADGSSPEVLDRLHVIRQELLQMRRAAWPHRDALNELLRYETNLIAEGTRVFFRDCYDHSIQIIDVLETQREMCADMRDLVLTMVGQRTNDIMRVLTIMSTIFIPLSFIAGVYGMNFDTQQSPYNMPELAWKYGYLFSLGIMALTAGGLLVFFYRKGWLRRQKTSNGH
ncbi:MAG: magnesium and cobalt transport protein CorA [Planctomycetota bacterium]|nr:MAG: magnesium and cobalt transport protein CorA [Planctomycetota bacterium]